MLGIMALAIVEIATPVGAVEPALATPQRLELLGQIQGSFVVSGALSTNPAEDPETPAADLSAPAADEVCGYSDEESRLTPYDIGDGWFICGGMDAVSNERTAIENPDNE